MPMQPCDRQPLTMFNDPVTDRRSYASVKLATVYTPAGRVTDASRPVIGAEYLSRANP